MKVIRKDIEICDFQIHARAFRVEFEALNLVCKYDSYGTFHVYKPIKSYNPIRYWFKKYISVNTEIIDAVIPTPELYEYFKEALLPLFEKYEDSTIKLDFCDYTKEEIEAYRKTKL